MHGLPTHLLSKSPKGEVFGEKKASVKTEAGDVLNGEVEGKQALGSTKLKNENFASLFANLTGKEKTEGKAEGKAEGKEKGEIKLSEVKSDTGEVLKNLLNEKNKETSFENKSPTKELGEANAAQVLISPVAGLGAQTLKNPSEISEGKVEQKIAKTTSNLDQLLNNLKGNSNVEMEEIDSSEKMDSKENAKPLIQDAHLQKMSPQMKSELKEESPLDFIINGSKTKNVSVSDESLKATLSRDSEGLNLQKKVMTGEDFLKNRESSEKKSSGKLAVLEGLSDLPKNNSQNVKGYGSGLSLLSDPLIKNTKDLAFKETKKGNSLTASDELRSPDLKVGAELSAIKAGAIPEIQNNKNNHGLPAETQTAANQKVLDLSKINTANTTEIIKRISDFVEQNQVANKSSLDLTVKHESLGEFKIQVSKMPTQLANQGSNNIDMQITTSSKEGHDFFVKNEVSLMKNLSQAGINLSDLRIVSSMSETSAFGQSDFKQSSSFGHNSDGTSKQFMSFESNNFSSDTSKGSERRKELWEEYQQRYGA